MGKRGSSSQRAVAFVFLQPGQEIDKDSGEVETMPNCGVVF
jgi:hypothetical protein